MLNRGDGTGVPQLLTVQEAADRLNASTKTVRRLIASKKLPAHRVGRLLRVAGDDLVAMLDRSRT